MLLFFGSLTSHRPCKMRGRETKRLPFLLNIGNTERPVRFFNWVPVRLVLLYRNDPGYARVCDALALQYGQCCENAVAIRDKAFLWRVGWVQAVLDIDRTRAGVLFEERNIVFDQFLQTQNVGLLFP